MKKDRIIALLRTGKSYNYIVQEVQCSKATINYYAKKVGLAPGGYRKKYNWKEVQEYYNKNHTLKACKEMFGFSNQAWWKAVQRKELFLRPRRKPLGGLLIIGSPIRGRNNFKLRLIEEKILKNECAECGINQWRGKPLVLRLDHINGIGNDYRRKNLRLLCPNCDSQMPTFGNSKYHLFKKVAQHFTDI